MVKLQLKGELNTLLRYFDNKILHIILKNLVKQKLITTATNVFCSYDDVHALMRNIIKIQTKVVFCTGNPITSGLSYSNKPILDTIYHEHMRYYSLSSSDYLFKMYNLKIFHEKFLHTVDQ